MGDLKNQLLWCRRAQWALAVALPISFLVMYVTAIRAPALRSQVIGERATAEQAKLEVARARAASLPEVERSTDVLRQRVERADKQLLQQGELPAVIGEVTGFGHDASLRNVQWRADARPRRSQQFTELPVEFTFI